jgi:hypothetical protein
VTGVSASDRHAYAALQAVVRDELESPLHPHTVEELKWYFGLLRATPDIRIQRADERFLRASGAFGRPRFYRLYRQWLKEGDGALDPLSSTVISDALASGAGRVESLVLPHRYDRLYHGHRGIQLSRKSCQRCSPARCGGPWWRDGVTNLVIAGSRSEATTVSAERSDDW